MSHLDGYSHKQHATRMPGPRYVWVRTSFSRKNTLKPWERTEAKAALDAFVAEHYRPEPKKRVRYASSKDKGVASRR